MDKSILEVEYIIIEKYECMVTYRNVQLPDPGYNSV